MLYIAKLVLVAVVVVFPAATAAAASGLVADWKFEEGQGDIARDSSGNGNDAALHGPSWVKQGNTFALEFDGIDDYVDTGDHQPLNLTGPVTIEVWMKPIACGADDSVVLSSPKGYEFVYSSRGLCWWSVSGRSYDVGGRPLLGEWNHIALTFDGKRKSVWVNGRLTASEPCAGPKGEGGKLVLGSAGSPNFRGIIGRVRVFDHALSREELLGHFKDNAGTYGFDPEQFKNVKVTPYYYLERGEAVLEMDYSGMRPLAGKGEIEVTLANKGDETKQLHHAVIALREVSDADANGWVYDPAVTEASIPCKDLAKGSYVITATLRDERGALPTQRFEFEVPPKVQLPSPREGVAGAVSPTSQPAAFSVELGKGGGFRVLANGAQYPFESRISWPNGDFNRLAASDDSPATGEKSWKIQVREANGKHFRVTASGGFYSIDREIEVFPTHVSVKDTFTNTTDSDLGLLIYNETPVTKEQIKTSRLSGYEGGGRQSESPGYRSSTVFIKDAKSGIGILPLDDVFVIHSVLYAEKDIAGVGDETFALAAGKSYTMEWAVYPTPSGDYWDFVNTVRRVEDRIGTVVDAPGFIAYGGMNRRQVVDTNYVQYRGIRAGIIPNLMQPVDNPGISLEGFEFIDFPRERELMRKQSDAMKLKHPGIKMLFHNAHTLYATNDSERFADSRLCGPDGKPKSSGGPPSFSEERIKEGWAWHVFYPRPGNSFHDAMMKSVDVMMDEMGMDGAFVDGFLLGYGGPWTYDGYWDGHSADIDPQTKTIKRKKGSVLLLMQPSMIEYSRRIRNRNGVVIANGSMITRSISKEKYIMFDAEIQAGPECHLAPTVISLSNGPFVSEKELYRDILDKLSWGVAYMPFNERIPLTHSTLGALQYPITFEEIRAGMIRGKERIVTMNSGVYTWPDDHKLHLVHKFDGRGAPAGNTFLSTVDPAGVTTRLEFKPLESAVIVPIPAELKTNAPVNLRVMEYTNDRLHLLLNGDGEATLEWFVGTSYSDWREGVFTNGGVNRIAVGVGDSYHVKIGDQATVIKEQDGTLFIPLKLSGQAELVVQRAEH